MDVPFHGDEEPPYSACRFKDLDSQRLEPRQHRRRCASRRGHRSTAAWHVLLRHRRELDAWSLSHTIVDGSTASAQASAFYEDFLTRGFVFTLRDDAGIPAPRNAEGVRVSRSGPGGAASRESSPTRLTSTTS